jgi:hypothetical protein
MCWTSNSSCRTLRVRALAYVTSCMRKEAEIRDESWLWVELGLRYRQRLRTRSSGCTTRILTGCGRSGSRVLRVRAKILA